MYASSKESGSIVGRVESAQVAIDLGDVADGTGCEESLVCEDPAEEGKRMTLCSGIDPETGKIIWVRELDEEAVDRRVLGTNQMPSMLHDTDRNDVYDKAISILVDNFQKIEGRAPLVLDVGAGTGLLSMMAARAGAAGVVGCEMFDTMASVATEVVEKNGLQEVVQIIPAKSSEIGLSTDLLVSELLDSSLLGESCAFSHADAIKRIIAPSYLETADEQSPIYRPAPEGHPLSSIPTEDRVIPHSAQIYAVLVQAEELQQMKDTSAIQFGGKGTSQRFASQSECKGGWPVVPLHWDRVKERDWRAKELSEEIAVLSFEFFNVKVDDDCSTAYDTVVTATSAGAISGVLMYWRLWLLSPNLDPKRECVYSTKPASESTNGESSGTNGEEDRDTDCRDSHEHGKGTINGEDTEAEARENNWQDHWVQVVYPLPEPLECREGQKFTITACHDNLRPWVYVNALEEEEKKEEQASIATGKAEKSRSNVAETVVLPPQVPVEKRPKLDLVSTEGSTSTVCRPCNAKENSTVLCGCGWHLLHSVDRLLMLNDTKRRVAYESALTKMWRSVRENCVENGNKGVVLDLGDGSELALTAAMLLKELQEGEGGAKMGEMGKMVKMGGFRVVSREDKQMSRILFSQLAAANGVEDQFEIWEGLDIADIDEEEEDEEGQTGEKSKIVALFSDCYQYQMASRQVWQALSFHYLRTSLHERLAPSATIVPATGFLIAAVFELTDLHVSHGDAGVVNGFDHSSFDVRQAGWHTHWLPYKLADYRKKLLSHPVILQKMDFTKPVRNLEHTTSVVPIIRAGRADCVAIWVDYDLTGETLFENGVHRLAPGWEKTYLEHFSSTSVNPNPDFPAHLKVNIRLFQDAPTVDESYRLKADSAFAVGSSDFEYEFDLVSRDQYKYIPGPLSAESRRNYLQQTFRSKCKTGFFADIAQLVGMTRGNSEEDLHKLVEEAGKYSLDRNEELSLKHFEEVQKENS